MKVRLVTAATIVGALALSMSGAQAAPAKVLDGKKVKVLTLKAVGAPQDHDSAFVTGSAGLDPERVECAMPRCARMDFVYKPAKGVRGDLAFAANWTVPAADIDLYVAEIAKDGSASELASCGASVGTSEKIFLDRTNFKPGKRYAVIVDFYRTANEAVTATVTMPGTNTVKATAPAAVDDNQKVNCGL